MNGISLVKHSFTKNVHYLFGLCFILAVTSSAHAETLNSANNDRTSSTASIPLLSDISQPSVAEKDETLPQLAELAKEGTGNEPTAQNVTSVSQLSDVQPTDWAFTSLQSLVERYGCIAGYPDRTFRGNRALSRYEFAAGLNACLDKINELISTGLADKVSKEDLAALKRLQEEFAAELATLKGRVDALEVKTATLESQQFSTTTKLSGLVFFNLTGATSGNGLRDPRGNIAQKPNITFSGLVWLNFNTSFTGKDLLVTQLAAGSGNSPINSYVDPGIAGVPGAAPSGFYNSTGTPFTDQTAGTSNGKTDVVLRELSYQFPIGGVTIVAGPRVNFYKYFDDNRYTFFLNGTSSFNSISSTLLTNAKRGAGAIIMAPLGQQLDFKIGFLAESNEFLPADLFNSAANPKQGLFGGNNALTAEATFKPNKDINLRFLYSRTNSANVFGCVGGVGATPSLPGTACGVVDANGNGNLSNGQADVFTFNFDWAVSKNFGLFGRYGISFTNLNGPTASVGSVTTQAFQIGAAFPDLFKEGAQGTISFVMPFNFTSGRNLLISGAGDGGTQYDLEASYFYPITKNISIVPALYFIFNPNNFSSNPMITVANLRLQFGF